MTGPPSPNLGPTVISRRRFVRSCQIAGSIRDMGSYPGLIIGPGRVEGQLFEVPDDVLPILDRFERFDPSDLVGSLYVRLYVRLIEPDTLAWVYAWNGPREDGTAITSGSWRTALAGRTEDLPNT